MSYPTREQVLTAALAILTTQQEIEVLLRESVPLPRLLNMACENVVRLAIPHDTPEVTTIREALIPESMKHLTLPYVSEKAAEKADRKAARLLEGEVHVS